MNKETTQKLETIARELEKRRQQHQSGDGRSRKWRSLIRRFFMVIALLFFATAGVFFVNFFRLNSDLIEGHIKQGIIPNLTQGRFHLQVGAISGNLINGVELENILIQNPHFESSSTMLTVPKVELKYSLLDILFGKLVLHRVRIDNPVLTLRRNEKGRGIWDFSVSASESVSLDETRWQKQDRNQALADRYLEDIRVNNLSILIPAPDRLIKDEVAARLIRLPAKTFQLNGVELALRKYPAEKFTTHLFRVSLPDKRDYMKFQVTRLKQNGNFTVNFDGLGQNFSFAVDNIGLDGRKVNLFDGRHRERLNLEWIWGRQNVSLPERIRGLNGVLHIAEISDLVKSWLPEEYRLDGALMIKAACAPDKNLYDAHVNLEISSASAVLPYMTPVYGLDLNVETADRKAVLHNLAFEMAGIMNSHKGSFNYADAANITADFDSDLAGDKLGIDAAYTRITPGTHGFNARLKRNSGSAGIEFVRSLNDKQINYSDFNFTAEIASGGSVAGIVPVNLLPAELQNRLAAYLDRVDMVGPLRLTSSFPAMDDWKTSEVDFSFDGARIVSKVNPQDFIRLDGGARLASATLELKNLRGRLEELEISSSGFAELDTVAPFVKDYRVKLDMSLPEGRNFAITSKRLQASLGLTHQPDFDSIELKGGQLAVAEAGSGIATNSVALNIDKLRFIRRGKALWADAVKGLVETGSFNPIKGERPQNILSSLSLEFFGIPMQSEIRADVAAGRVESFSFKGGGGNFARLLEAVKTQPEGRDFLKKYPLDINGNFNFAVLGSGNLEKPELDGFVRFPALNVRLPDFQAKLPFYGQLKTHDDGYHATLKAGQASVKVKDVSFDLAKSEAELIFADVASGSNMKMRLNGSSGIFGANFKVAGVLLPGKKQIEKLDVSVKSSKIETLAAEIARIGRFATPFDLSGGFSASASLNGPFAAPSSRGEVEVSKINLQFPLLDKKNRAVLKASDFAGKLKFDKRGEKFFGLELPGFSGKILGSSVSIKGKAHLKDLARGLKPVLDGLSAEVAGLDLAALYGFLKEGVIPASLLGTFAVKSGQASGRFALSGTPERLMATGTVSLSDGAVAFAALPDNVSHLAAELAFDGRTDSGYAKIAIIDLSGRFGRSEFKIPEGWLEDPTRTGKFLLKGSFDRLFPADLIKMLGGMVVKSVKFPQEGWLSGSLEANGTLSAPQLQAELKSSDMTVEYDSGAGVFTVPLGSSETAFDFNPQTGQIKVQKGVFALLGGQIKLEAAQGVFLPTKPFTMSLNGDMTNIDFGRLQMKDKESFKGIMGGAFKAAWEGPGNRDAVFNLEFKDIYLPSLPLVDPAAVAQSGMEFIEHPDMRVGQLNFYVTSDEDDMYKGKLLIADGLFAGPHLRLELGNSEFDPSALQLEAKLMINPQSLRHTDIGRKMKKWTVTAQDRSTGVPFVDLSVSGSWDKPELMSRQIKRKAERRVKRNFIGRIFGGHRPHKASVEELMQWFPGWKKGM